MPPGRVRLPVRAPRRRGTLLRGTVLAVLAGGFLLPLLAGLGATLGAAAGYLPGRPLPETPSLQPLRSLLAEPGFLRAVGQTLGTGLASTVLALVLAASFCGLVHQRLPTRLAGRSLAPLLAAPHSALAIGLAFLLAPWGWIARWLSPWATGWEFPPDLPLVQDPLGIALVLGLLTKEVPFLLLVLLAALAQLPVQEDLQRARALGYSRAKAWVGVVLPRAYPLVRLPVLFVLAFSLSVVDMALVLGPTQPPTLAVAVTRWFLAPDPAFLGPAFAGAALQLAIVLAVMGGWLLGERAVAAMGRAWLARGSRGGAGDPWLAAAGLATTVVLLLGLLALVALGFWAFAERWPFPAAWPTEFSLARWTNLAGGWGEAFGNSLALGAATTAASLLLAMLWLEGEDRGHLPRARWATVLVALPLLLPQVAFLYGLQVVLLRAGVGPGFLAVAWAQALFVLPYTLIVLSPPWKALDPRLLAVAASLGAGPNRRWLTVKLPLLLRPLLTAGAVGFAVSVALYLPTLFLGAGRVPTLTTEAVTLASGGDRRLVGLFALLQALLPLVAYLLALLLPRWIWRHRRALAGGSA